MGNIKETQYFQAVQDKKVEVSDVLEQVYIASHKGARSLIMKVERDEILEELMAVYIDARLK